MRFLMSMILLLGLLAGCSSDGATDSGDAETQQIDQGPDAETDLDADAEVEKSRRTPAAEGEGNTRVLDDSEDGSTPNEGGGAAADNRG